MFECQEIKELFEPTLYWRSPLNIVGLPISATAREIRRRREDVAADVFANASRCCHTALLPTRLIVGAKEIDDAFECLKDPYRRAFYSLFWFWPTQGLSEKDDSNISLITTGRAEDRKRALADWYGRCESDAPHGLIARHNLAVYSHLIALLLEDNYMNGEQIKNEDCERHWDECIKFWDRLADDDAFWDLFTEHIRRFDDPRMTSGFVRRFRHDLPLGMDQINARLLNVYVKNLDAGNAARQVKYMNQSQQGLDDVEGSLDPVVRAVEKMQENFSADLNSRLKDNPRQGLELAERALEFGAGMRNVAMALSPSASMNEKRVADVAALMALHCQVSYANETKDWCGCVSVLERTLALATGGSVRERIKKNLEVVRGNVEHSKIDALYESVGSFVWDAAEAVDKSPAIGLQRAQYIADHADGYLSEARKLAAEISSFSFAEFADEIALSIQSCLVPYANETKDYEHPVELQRRALKIAQNASVQKKIQANLDVLLSNLKATECAVCHRHLKNPGAAARRLKFCGEFAGTPAFEKLVTELADKARFSHMHETSYVDTSFYALGARRGFEGMTEDYYLRELTRHPDYGKISYKIREVEVCVCDNCYGSRLSGHWTSQLPLTKKGWVIGGEPSSSDVSNALEGIIRRVIPHWKGWDDYKRRRKQAKKEYDKNHMILGMREEFVHNLARSTGCMLPLAVIMAVTLLGFGLIALT